MSPTLPKGPLRDRAEFWYRSAMKPAHALSITLLVFGLLGSRAGFAEEAPAAGESSASSKRAEARNPSRRARALSRIDSSAWGIGGEILGGPLIAFDLERRFNGHASLSGTVGPRIALGRSVYANLCLTATGDLVGGKGTNRLGGFVRAGTTLPIPGNTEVLAAAGGTWRAWLGSGMVASTLRLGLGGFPVRDLSYSYREQGRALILLSWSMMVFPGTR